MNNEKDFIRITSTETDKQKIEEAIDMMKESMEKVPLSESDIKFYELLGFEPGTAEFEEVEIDEILDRLAKVDTFDLMELFGIHSTLPGLREFINESDDFIDDDLDDDVLDDYDLDDDETALFNYFDEELEDSE